MRVLVACARFFLELIYAFLKLLPVRHKVVMISRQADSPSVDFRLLKRCMEKQDPQIQVVMLCRTLDGKLHAEKTALIRYGFHMLRQMYEIATAEAVVLDTYCIVVSLLHHRKNLRVMQMWHSMGSMKKFGYTALDTQEGVPSSSAHLLHMHENYTTIFASSPVYAADLAAGFGYGEEIVKVMPLPRTDLLASRTYKNRRRQQILEAYPNLRNKKVILYCPTFRQDESCFREAVIKLAETIHPEAEALVMNPHPLSKLSVEAPGLICGTSFSSFDLLSVADVMITDYSCIAYEAAFCGIPLYFYDFDMDDYLSERGLAIDYYAEIPGPALHDPQALMESIRNGGYDMDRLRAFAEKYICYSGHAGADLAEYVLSEG